MNTGGACKLLKNSMKNSQVFITSHSPAFFAQESENKIIVRIGNDKGKTVILKPIVELDEELGYIELYRGFIKQLNDLKDKETLQNKELKQLREQIRRMTAPILLTEGKTDAELLMLAAKKLGLQEYEQWHIQPITMNGTQNNTVLSSYLMALKDNGRPTMPVIGMFDRDTKIEIPVNGNKVDARDESYVKVADNIYAFAIPVPHGRKETDQISIEHFFTDEEIKTEYEGKRLFLGNEFYHTGVAKDGKQFHYKGGKNVADTIKIIEHESKAYVTNVDGTGDYSLSKEAFVTCIREDKEKFRDISFEEFRKIFDVLDRMLQESTGESANDQL